MRGDDAQPAPVEGFRALAALGLAAAAGVRPDEVRAWRALGRRRLGERAFEAACDILAYACFLDPGDAATWELLGTARLAAGRPGDAAAPVAAAHALSPTWRSAALAALCAEALDDADAAANWRRRAWSAAPDDVEVCELLRRAIGAGEEPVS